jgi:hypothetical protein
MMNLLLIIGLILFILWLLGLITSFTLGGYLYIVLVVAIIMFVIWLISAVVRRR